MQRRDFLKVCAATSAAGSLSGCPSFAKHTSGLPSEILNASGEIVVNVARFQGQQNASLLLAHPQEKYPLALIKRADQYTACLMHCPHQGCETAVVEKEVVCPCHGSRFDLSGALLKGPAEQNLKAYPVRVEADKILIKI